MATRTESGADLTVMNEQGQHARNLIDMEQIRHMQYIPKTKDIWHHQYIYKSEDRGGDVIPLTGEMIDSFLSTPVYGRNPHIDVKYIKKCVIMADALFLPEFINPFLIKCKAGIFFNIFPHTYVVPCNDPLVRQTSVGFVEIIDKSQNALTLGSLLANHELFFELLRIQPDCISINIGLSDIKQENLSWHPNQIPKEYLKKFQELITHMQTYFLELVVGVHLQKTSPILSIFYQFMLQLTVRDITCKIFIRQRSTPTCGVLLTMVSPENFISIFLMRSIGNCIAAKQKCLINFRL